MDQATWARLLEQSAPEIRTADLSDFALQTACWGAPGGRGLALLDEPPAAALEAATRHLETLGALVDGRATSLGRRLAELPVEPRIGRALLEATEHIGVTTAAEICALLSEELRLPGADVTREWRRATRGNSWRAQARRLERLAASHLEMGAQHAEGRVACDDDVADERPSAASGRIADGGPDGAGDAQSAIGNARKMDGAPDDAHSARAQLVAGGQRHDVEAFGGDLNLSSERAEGYWALVISLAYPERVARLRESTPGARGPSPSGQGATRTAGRRYLLANGVGAILPEGSPLTGEPWLAIAHLERPQGRADARIRSAVPIGEAEAIDAARALLVESDDVVVRRNRLRARHTRHLGAIELTAIESDVADPRHARSFLTAAIACGDIAPQWSRAARELQRRLAFLHEVMGVPWPDVDDHVLLDASESWLAPEIEAAARHGAVPMVGVDQLRRILPWPEAARLEDLAPEKVKVAGGAELRIDYSDDRPRIRLRVQEAFGWVETPRVADDRVAVTVELLSPAGRTVAVTDDLGSFWRGPYAQVRAEMRGRYPRHSWPEDPLHAEPARHVRRARHR
ncbi:ATP-dependent helicase C-terminal domain-containing protein [Actinobaculum sp. 313]|nr:ATP-dependent helicase C-terminal domain-containing protein [Actinobaculum sp. 313]